MLASARTAPSGSSPVAGQRARYSSVVPGSVCTSSGGESVPSEYCSTSAGSPTSGSSARNEISTVWLARASEGEMVAGPERPGAEMSALSFATQRPTEATQRKSRGQSLGLWQRMLAVDGTVASKLQEASSSAAQARARIT
jgi:hypothetical protein